MEHEWIHIEDEMPRSGMRVLVEHCDGHTPTGWILIGQWNERRRTFFKDGTDTWLQVLYWMPLPEGPP